MTIAGSLNYDTKLDTKGFETGLNKVGSIGKGIAAGVGVAVTAVAVGLTALITESVKQYAELEQNIGGVETLFKDSADKVIENAKKAYETAGMSANQYMQTVTSFSASLLQSLGGDTEKAAQYADRAIIDMSDNANKMGTDMELIQNAYQGFAKQNYTMLDNLKLGYGGTQTEMARLISDASKMTDVQKELGITVDSNSMSFGNIVNAISVMQKSMGIAGTTSEEASKTITGSVNAMKAAFSNFLSGAGGIEEVINTTVTAITNISGAVVKMAPQIIDGLIGLIESLLPMIPPLLDQLIPVVLDGVTRILTSIIEMAPQLVDTILTLILKVVDTITSNLPLILQTGITIILELARGLTEAIPDLIPIIIDCVMLMIDTILDNLDEFIIAALDIILALAFGLIDALPKLLAKIPTIITKIVLALTEPKMVAKLVSAALQLIIALAGGLIKAIPQLLLAIPQIISKLVSGLSSRIKNTNWKSLGKDILRGVLNGLLDFGTIVYDTIAKVGNKITSSIKNFFGINSPSRLMRDEVGKFLPEGIAVGVTANTDSALKSIDKMNNDIFNKMSEAVNIETGKMSFGGTTGSVSQILSANSVIKVENYNTLELDGEKVYENQQTIQKNKNLQYGFGGANSK